MRKKLLLLCFVVVFSSGVFIGCNVTKEKASTDTAEASQTEEPELALFGINDDTLNRYAEVHKSEKGAFGMLIPVPGYRYLFYASGTGIVYIVETFSSGYHGYSFMAPYYSENGNLFRYEDGFLVEITD